MKLSRLVAYLNDLDRIDLQQITHTVDHAAQDFIDPMTRHDFALGDVTDDMVAFQQRRQAVIQRMLATQQGIQTLLQDLGHDFTDLRQQIRAEIDRVEPAYFAESLRLYREGMRNDPVQHMLNRRPSVEDDIAAYLRARINTYSDWHYPGMVIRPGIESWIKDLVSLDPLYIVDINNEMLQPCLDFFPEKYQQRLRSYLVQEYTETFSLAALPRQQMALVLVYNYFNYKPIEMIRTMFQEIFHCLRPGGVLALTFNDCDRYGAVELVERSFTCYTPGRLVRAAAELTGFEITHSYEMDAAITWLELRRPGTLHSLRGGQTLAKIQTKNQNPL